MRLPGASWQGRNGTIGNMRAKLMTILAVSAAVASCGQSQPVKSDPTDAKSAAPAGFALPASGVLGLTDLANFAKLERDFVKPDDFSKGFDDSPLYGRQFAVTIPVNQYSGSSSTPTEWTYDAEKEELTLTVKSGDMTSFTPTLPIQQTTELGPKKKMSNAFGAEVEVTPMETWSIEVGGDQIGVFPKTDDPMNMNAFQSLTHTTKMKPEQAKALIADLNLRLEGFVEKDGRGQTVNCYSDHSSATITSPTEWDKHNCVIQVHLSRIAFVTKNGKVIREWKDESAKARSATPAPTGESLDAPAADSESNAMTKADSDYPDE